MEQKKKCGMRKRIGTMILAMSLLAFTNGMTVFAETTSISSQAETVSNPVHYCTNAGATTDTTTWSYVYFGSYPQTEVTDEDLISKIDSAIELYGIAGDVGMDVWVDGVKYRRVSKEDSKYITNYGKVAYRYFRWERIKWRVLENSDNTLFLMSDMNLDCKKYNESSEETSWSACTIRTWLKDSFYNTAFSSEEQAIIKESTNQNGSNAETGVEGCEDTTDKVFLLSVEEATNPQYGFCNIIDEYDDYERSASRTTYPTDYSYRRGTSKLSDSETEPSPSWYWLRSVGNAKNYAITVRWETGISLFGNGVSARYIGVCPALRIKYTSDIWTTTDDHTSGAGGEDTDDVQTVRAITANKNKTDYRVGETLNLEDLTVEAVYATGNVTLKSSEYQVDTSAVDMNISGIYPLKITYGDKNAEVKISVSKAGMPTDPVHYCKKNGSETEYTEWQYISMGSYPQTQITDQVLIEKIEKVIAEESSKEGAETVTESRIDVTVDGEKYRRVTNTDDTYQYFKWEKIMWRVLHNNGEDMFLMADKALDCQPYHSTETDITWENSNLRSWLNESFYKNAFTEAERKAILKHENINNGTNSDYASINGGNNTEDYVSILSAQDMLNSAYGFCSYNSDAGYITRRFTPTDYTEATGLKVISYENEPKGCAYFLRSHGSSLQNAAIVLQKGIIFSNGISVATSQGICPVIHIKVSADEIWSYEGSATDNNQGDTGQENIENIDKENKDENGEVADNQPVKVTNLKIKAPSQKLAAGKKVKLTLTVTPKNATNKSVTWKSGNKKYATVSKTGKVTIKKAGIGKTVTITAVAKDGSKVKAKFKFKIMKHSVKSVKIKASKKTLKAGKSMTLKTSIKTTGKSVNKKLKWTTSNKKYATVNSKGKVTAKKAGKGKSVTITVISTDGSNKKAKIKLKIK